MKKNVKKFIQLGRIDAAKQEIEVRKQNFLETYNAPAAEVLSAQAERCLECGNPYCHWKCPLHNYIPQWLKLAFEGRIIEAAELTHQTNSFPEICGRVCPQDRLCEGACTLSAEFGAVTIGNVEKYIVDEAFKIGWKPTYPQQISNGYKVAIIGAGPAGLACADILNRNGVKVTVYERSAAIGGLLTYGIPGFKLEKHHMRKRHELLQDAGVEFKLNCEFGKDITFTAIEANYDAVFVGVGTYKPVSDPALPLKEQQVFSALDFLSSVNEDLINEKPIELAKLIKGKKVVVLGGGDTAMDCIRTSIRIGAADVSCSFRRGSEFLAGSRKEYLNACEEGGEFIFDSQPIGFVEQDGKVTAVKFVKTSVVEDIKTKQLVFNHVAGSEFEAAADLVIIAFGFIPDDLPWLKSTHVEVNKQGRIQVSAKSQQTKNPKVFAGGDITRGSSLVVHAIADGMKAAREILEFLA